MPGTHHHRQPSLFSKFPAAGGWGHVCVDTGLMRWESAVIKETLTPGWYQEAVLGCYHLRRRHEWGLQLPEDLAQGQGPPGAVSLHAIPPCRRTNLLTLLVARPSC